jgi:hypothetical protein
VLIFTSTLSTLAEGGADARFEERPPDMTTASHTDRRVSTLLCVVVAPTAVVAGLCVAVAAQIEGRTGAVGAAVGAAMTLVFFLVGLSSVHLVRRSHPSLMMLVGLMTYGLQCVALLAVFAAVRRDEDIDQTLSADALGVTIIACTLTFTVGQILAARRDRTPLYDDPGGAR